MTENIGLEEAVALLLHANDILLLCHKNPDGDTIGSATALCHGLHAVGKTAAVLCADGFPPQYGYMNIPSFNGQFTPGYIVAVDVASIQLFGDAIRPYTEHVDLCIDHHRGNSGYANDTLVDPDAAATAELVALLLGKMSVEITPLLADCLYTGLATDTGCFQFSNTTARTHRIAADLMEDGAHVDELNALLFESKSRGRIQVEQIALSHLEYHYQGRCALTYLTRDEIEQAGAVPSELESLSGLPRTVAGVQVGVMLRQQPGGSYKVSVRTTKEVDACAIARHLGGGGHERAAGCELEGNLDNTKAALLSEVGRFLQTADEPQGGEG